MTSEAQDPTRVGSEPPRDAGPALVLSRAEIIALATKAARGAGRHWGEAEEAGWACGWLAQAGLPGPEMLLRLLTNKDVSAPQPDSGRWSAPGLLCPLRAGVAMMDHAELPEGPRAGLVRLDDVAGPLFLLPFVARMAAELGCPLTYRMGASVLTFGAGGATPDLRRLRSALATTRADVTLCSGTASVGLDETPGPFDGLITRETWQALDAIAMRTTVPASDLSRQRAGAQASDND
ncbi:DUF3726 domain-containing protein [uncultured Roseovarius sp.]|uniref:DUF3726 domain-containing protein n=1 Tax=uncultured Roseovarius sp. TaxID=293344 RepID=UPI00260E6A81|nr:DUF3726 domain-containing protein [uncultured Roseovarius sp.]